MNSSTTNACFINIFTDRKRKEMNNEEIKADCTKCIYYNAEIDGCPFVDGCQFVEVPPADDIIIRD